MSDYPNLLAPLDLQSGTLRNRIVMGAMHTRLETLDRANERLAAFYEARARGEVGLVLTGGYAPNAAGIFEPGAPRFSDESQLDEHHAIVGAVHAGGGKIALQIVHSGRYAKHPLCVGASAIRSRINPIAPRARRPRRSGKPSPTLPIPPRWHAVPAMTGSRSWGPRAT